MIITKEKTGIDLNVLSDFMEAHLVFTKEEFKDLIGELNTVAVEIWGDKFELKEVTSMGNDYYEYYDRKYDNNGYLSVGKYYNDFIVKIERPCKESHRFYRLNKAKAQTFINDCIKLLEGK